MSDEYYNCIPPVNYDGYCEDCGELSALRKIFASLFFNKTPLGDNGIVQTSVLRMYISQRTPWKHMFKRDRDARIARLLEYFVRDGVLEYLTAKAMLLEYNELTRRDGIYMRCIDLGPFSMPACPIPDVVEWRQVPGHAFVAKYVNGSYTGVVEPVALASAAE